MMGKCSYENSVEVLPRTGLTGQFSTAIFVTRLYIFCGYAFAYTRKVLQPSNQYPQNNNSNSLLLVASNTL